MKNNKLKMLLIVALVVIVGGGLYLFGGGEFFQGKLSRFTGKCVGSRDALVVSLAPTSPSGSRTVSLYDDIMEFDIYANEPMNVKKVEFKILSDPGDITTTALADVVPAIRRGTTGLPGVASLVGSSSSVRIRYVFDSAVPYFDGSSGRWRLRINSADLIDEDSGVDDDVTVYVVGLYDELNREICTNLPISGNTLAY